ncbi:right-handed parallel beta-helix repeat-containing protein [Stieleria sp. ICT_E10.1]|uniref:right-handed parallel beta-helix repeat-containing protein n=1 Tax=Stieleria sedimenti TaxID=2976331 RepID=UPI00218015E4|nr:right-handed parallel beta-helix repeat-containing protein [Stieleria sedimenti]MCS7467727.1 right-handed parallel beta-helix repeat-containing protein [Stieleria sedimenti]
MSTFRSVRTKEATPSYRFSLIVNQDSIVKEHGCLKLQTSSSWIGCLIINLICIAATLSAADSLGVVSYDGDVYRPYVAAGVRPSDEDVRLHTDMFLPLFWNDSSLLFADVRGQFADVGGGEGNWGLAIRHLMDCECILGAYGFYDLKQSANGNWFHQGTIGAELLTRRFDLRFNGYLPEGGSQTAVAPTAVISNGNLVVQNNEERAYHGFDGEVGALLWQKPQWFESEIRGFAGFFHFETDSANARSVAGPRLRAEWRCYDLPWLGLDSRLTLGAQYQHDDVRGDQSAAVIAVRLPLGTDRGRSRRMCVMQRRMTDVIVRDIDVVTRATPTPGGQEAALHAEHDFAIGSVTVLDADTDDVPDAVATSTTDTVILDGSAGELELSHSIVVQDGQNLLGGGFTVKGADTGAVARFGTPIHLRGSDDTQSVIVMANNARVGHFSIAGGLHGISSDNGTDYDDLANVHLFGNEVTDAAENGFRFAAIDADSSLSGNRAFDNAEAGFWIDDNSGTLDRNTSQDNQTAGFVIASNSGSVTANRAMENGEEGFLLVYNDGLIFQNEAIENTMSGFVVSFNEGDISENESTDNASSGFEVETNNGVVSNNVAFDNFLDGFWFEDNYDTIQDNLSVFNFGNGFTLNDTAGTVSGNYAASNSFNGFEFRNNFGDFEDNTSEQNGSNGFDFKHNAGTIARNQAIGNDDDGYDFSYNLDTFSDNEAISNWNDGFQFYSNDHLMTGNQAIGNAEDGFYFNQNNGLFDGNYAEGNFDDGVDLVENFGTLSNNESNDNADQGYTGLNSGTSTDNVGSGNAGGDDF